MIIYLEIKIQKEVLYKQHPKDSTRSDEEMPKVAKTGIP